MGRWWEMWGGIVALHRDAWAAPQPFADATTPRAFLSGPPMGHVSDMSRACHGRVLAEGGLERAARAVDERCAEEVADAPAARPHERLAVSKQQAVLQS